MSIAARVYLAGLGWMRPRFQNQGLLPCTLAGEPSASAPPPVDRNEGGQERPRNVPYSSQHMMGREEEKRTTEPDLGFREGFLDEMVLEFVWKDRWEFERRKG